MQPLRSLILRRPALLAALLLAVLAVRLLAPAGYMPGTIGGGPVLRLCPDAAPMPMAAGDHGGRHGGKGDHAPGAQPCAFAGLGLPALGEVAAAFIAAPLPFAVAALPAPRRAWPPPARPRLRPPLRAPPLTA